MTPREKRLPVMVGIGLAVLAGLGLDRAYTAASRALDLQYTREQKKARDLEGELAIADAQEGEWKRLGSQTLSMDEKEANGLFRTELLAVTRESGLSDAAIVLGSVRPVGRNGLRVLTYTVSAEATAEPIVSFLFLIQRQPYLVRCKDLTLTGPADRPSHSGSGSGSAPSRVTGRLAMSVVLETPILPSDRRVPRIPTAVLAQGLRRTVPRTGFGAIEDYQRSIKGSLFAPYADPMVVVPARGDGGIVTPQKEDRDPIVETKPPEPADAALVLARVLSSPRSQQVVLEDAVDKKGADRRVAVGDAMYEGTLIFICSTGAVTERSGGRRLFHPVGLPLRNGQPLTESDYPQEFNALAKLERRLAGISAPE
jgi:hypothetical protein